MFLLTWFVSHAKIVRVILLERLAVKGYFLLGVYVEMGESNVADELLICEQ